MPPIQNQGRSANEHGKILEDQLTPALERNGFVVVGWGDYKADQAKWDAIDRLAITQVPYTTIYNRQGRTEYVVIIKSQHRRIRIECKFQQAAGSVDEKFPYMYMEGALAYPEDETIFCIGGDGFKSGAKDWLKHACESRWLLDDKPNRKISMMDPTQTTVFINLL
jgi:hypothetical protein